MRQIGDSLRHKLEQRPERASLVEHHILEDSTADASIQEKQRLLKRARLQDSLSERLAHRPGPLELVEKNILAEPELHDAVRGQRAPTRGQGRRTSMFLPDASSKLLLRTLCIVS